jgi:hypothetical protein
VRGGRQGCVRALIHQQYVPGPASVVL